EMAGSSSCFNSVVAEPLPDLDVTHYPSITGRRGYVTEVGINTTGEAVDWLAELFYGGTRRGDYARLEQAVTGTPPGAGGLVFAPVLGDGERDDPALRGAVTGLSLRHDRGAVARAALAGSARAGHRVLPAPRSRRRAPRRAGGDRLRRPRPAGGPGPDVRAGHRTAGVRRGRGHGGLEPEQSGGARASLWSAPRVP